MARRFLPSEIKRVRPTLQILPQVPERWVEVFARSSSRPPRIPSERARSGGGTSLAIRCGMQDDFPRPVEARIWLTENRNPWAFATNRFGVRRCALEFVEALYALGAVEVLVDNIMLDAVSRDGGPYADTLRVRMPEHGPARCALEEFCEEQGPGDVPPPGDFRMDVLERELELWWD